MFNLRNVVAVLLGIGKALLMAVKFAKQHGLDGPILDVAISLVSGAELSFPTNEERLAHVVKELMRRFGLKESVARFAAETAVLALKAKRQGL